MVPTAQQRSCRRRTILLADADCDAWQRDAESRRGHRARGLVTSSQRLVTGMTVVLARAGHDAWPLGLPMMEWQVKR